MTMLARLRAALRGWKTIVVAVAFALVGLADVVQAIDLRAVLELLGVPQEQIGGVVTVISTVFLVLRAVTTGPVGKRKD